MPYPSVGHEGLEQATLHGAEPVDAVVYGDLAAFQVQGQAVNLENF